ncbi:hypothetical protein [Streptomyces sp. NPDC051684]|uniref:hypothetical protein n=1 Tax=Streptomyces sp. NPDC051684 TaxID=3365670 RepID=UPI0037A26A5B
MGRQPEPRHITLGGREAVALTLDEYAQLLASRRQIGGQSARVRVLAQEAKRTARLVQGLEELIEQCGADSCPAGGNAPSPRASQKDHQKDGECPRCAIAELLRRHRDVTNG